MNNAQESNKPKKVVGIVLNVILWLFLVFAFIMMTLAFTSASNEYGVPIIGDKVVLTVKSDSMKPTFKSGDMLIARALNNEEKDNLQVGDIITFYADLDGDGDKELNTHRIISVSAGTFKTQGDNPETNPVPDDYIVFKDHIVATWKEGDTRIGGVGNVIGFLQSRTGFLLFVILPLIGLFTYEVVRLILMILKIRGKDKKNITEAEKDEIRRLAIEEYKRSLSGEEAVGVKEGDDKGDATE